MIVKNQCFVKLLLGVLAGSLASSVCSQEVGEGDFPIAPELGWWGAIPIYNPIDKEFMLIGAASAIRLDGTAATPIGTAFDLPVPAGSRAPVAALNTTGNEYLLGACRS